MSSNSNSALAPSLSPANVPGAIVRYIPTTKRYSVEKPGTISWRREPMSLLLTKEMGALANLENMQNVLSMVCMESTRGHKAGQTAKTRRSSGGLGWISKAAALVQRLFGVCLGVSTPRCRNTFPRPGRKCKSIHLGAGTLSCRLPRLIPHQQAVTTLFLFIRLVMHLLSIVQYPTWLSALW
jgi:hypothetical protein